MKSIGIFLLIALLQLNPINSSLSQKELRQTTKNIGKIKVDTFTDRTISMTEILVPGQTFPNDEKYKDISEAVFGAKNVATYKLQSERNEFTKNQMTVLGHEISRRHSNFQSQISAKSIKSKLDEESDLFKISQESFLNGLGGVWKYMENVKPS